MTEPRRVLRAARRAILALIALLAGYGALRFGILRLPEGAVSPLRGIHGGDRLLVDRLGRAAAIGEVVLYRGPTGELLLGRISAPPGDLSTEARRTLAEGALWILAERAGARAPDSRELGPIPLRAVEGRVVLVVPW